MIRCSTIEEFKGWRQTQVNVGFVPTMGALHPGHLSLLPLVQTESSSTCVSIFVNPLQFGAGEDLAKYPRPLERDLELLREAGVDCVFLPTSEELTHRQEVTLNSGPLGRVLEGSFRPGHFDGVATIVAKLFNIVQPSVAAFGLKDLQQCAVIRALVRDLAYPIQLRFGATLREDDGLAMSSRNSYLSDGARATAPLLHSVLKHLKTQLQTDVDRRSELIADARSTLTSAGFEVDYLELVHSETMMPTFELHSASLVVAARLQGVRLIDNISCEV